MLNGSFRASYNEHLLHLDYDNPDEQYSLDIDHKIIKHTLDKRYQLIPSQLGKVDFQCYIYLLQSVPLNPQKD